MAAMGSCSKLKTFLLLLGIVLSAQVLKDPLSAGELPVDSLSAVVQEQSTQTTLGLLGCTLSDAQGCFHCCHGNAHHTHFLGVGSHMAYVDAVEVTISFTYNAPPEDNVFPVEHLPPKALS